MKADNSQNDELVLCILCDFKVRFEEFDEHIRFMHSNDERVGEAWIEYNRALRKFRSKKKQLISNQQRDIGEKHRITHEMHEVILDESGFITSPDLWIENAASQNSHDQHLGYVSSKGSKPTESVDDFKKIASLEKASKNKGYKKKINRYVRVTCPICNIDFLYYRLFDHISAKHPDQNPKILMAKINRELRGEE